MINVMINLPLFVCLSIRGSFNTIQRRPRMFEPRTLYPQFIVSLLVCGACLHVRVSNYARLAHLCFTFMLDRARHILSSTPQRKSGQGGLQAPLCSDGCQTRVLRSLYFDLVSLLI